MSQSCLVQHANMRQYKSARENGGVEIRLRHYFGQIVFRYFAITCEEVSAIWTTYYCILKINIIV